MKSSKLKDAAAKVEKAAADKAAAEQSHREALEEKAECDGESEQRRQAYDRAWLATFDDAALEAEQRAALAKFEAVVQVDPLVLAWLEVERLRLRRFNMASVAVNFASTVGVRAPVSPVGGAPALMAEAVQRAVQQLAGRLEGELVAEVFAARERAAEGDDDGA